MYEATAEFYERDQRRQVVTGGKAAWSVDDSIRIADDHHQGAALRNILAKPGGLEKAGNPPRRELDKAPAEYPWEIDRADREAVREYAS